MGSLVSLRAILGYFEGLIWTQGRPSHRAFCQAKIGAPDRSLPTERGFSDSPSHLSCLLGEPMVIVILEPFRIPTISMGYDSFIADASSVDGWGLSQCRNRASERRDAPEVVRACLVELLDCRNRNVDTPTTPFSNASLYVITRLATSPAQGPLRRSGKWSREADLEHLGAGQACCVKQIFVRQARNRIEV